MERHADAAFIAPNHLARIYLPLLRGSYQRKAIWNANLRADIKRRALFRHIAKRTAYRHISKSY
jgi:hypothetical protein